MTTSAPVAIVVVNYNGGERLRKCLTALRDDSLSPGFEVFIVDNASEDGSQKIGAEFASLEDNFHFLPSSTNHGYAGGINLAWPQAPGQYVAVLNMDVRVSPGWLIPLVDYLDANPRAGAVTPLILLEDDQSRINALGQSVHVTGLGFNRSLGKSLAAVNQLESEVSGIHGGAFIIRRSLLEEMVGLDETGFLYHEDVDLSWLLLIKGHTLHCIPTSIVFHDYYLTMYPEKLYLLERNRVAMLLAYLRPVSLALLTPWLLFTECLMWAYCLLRGWKFLRAKAASYAWVMSQRTQIAERKLRVEKQRKRSDWTVLRKLDWGYAWDQFISLGKERNLSERQPQGGLPIEISRG